MAEEKKKNEPEKKPERDLVIKIEGETYALNEIPSENSSVVKAEKKKLLGVIDLKALVIHLGRIGGFIRVAYNGVGAAGYEHTEEQIEIQQLGYDITDLCDKSAVTVAKFKKASSDVLIDLQCTYGYLVENMEDEALETLSSVSKLAGEMEKAAMELHEDFKAEEGKVVATLKNTQRSRKIQASKVEEEKKRRIELEERIKHEQELNKKHQEKLKLAEARRLSLEQQEDNAISEIGLSTVESVINALTAFLRIKVFDMEDSKTKAALLKENRLEALETEEEIRKNQQEALANMSAFTAKLRQCSNDQEMAECAVEALHEAAGALKKLSVVMKQAALFWKQMQEHCRSINGSEIKSQVERLLQKDKNERLKVWTSSSFKRKAIYFYSGWVALESVCTTYMEQIEKTQKDLYKYI